MKADGHIVFMYNQIPAIYFPVGKLEDGGSCEFMTGECLEYCPSQVKNEHEIRVMKFFVDSRPAIIIDKILSDLSFYGSVHIIWFEWGDCPSMLEDKICEVLIRLDEIGVVQNVYTRNKSFWKKVPLTGSLRITYRTETVEDAVALSLSSGKLTCCPNLDEGKARLYYQGKLRAKCCGVWCEWFPEKEIRFADCCECYLYKRGCFQAKEVITK